MLLKRLSLAAIPFILALTLHAQYDSSTLNTGLLRLSTQFTQHITIKGEDLEHFPYSSLEQAINVYFNGSYTNDQDILYVIDGNVGGDINAYAVYDIESITLIQDARAKLAGVQRAQQLVIVRTRSGMTRTNSYSAVASSYITKRREKNGSNLYHQLFASGRSYHKNMEVGGSLNYLHEAYPIAVQNKMVEGHPRQLNRFVANAWLISTFKRSILTVRLNASPQQTRFAQYYIDTLNASYNEDNHANNLHLSPSATLLTRFNARFLNQLDAGYTKKHTKYINEQLFSYEDGGFDKITSESSNRYSQIFLRDELGINYAIGKWKFNPRLNIYGVSSKNHIRIDTTTHSNDIRNIAEFLSEYESNERGIVFTPAINITNNEIFNFQGGVQYSTIKNMVMKAADHRLHPFASLSLDLIKAMYPQAPVSLIIHASYVESKSEVLNYFFPSRKFYTYSNGRLDSIVMPILYGNLYKPHHITSGGITFNFMGDRLKVLYTHEGKSYFIDDYINTTLGPENTIIASAAESRIRTNRFSLQYQNAKGRKFNYSTMLGVYNMKSEIRFGNPNLTVSPVNSQQYYPRPGWSGGLTQQFGYGNFVAGISCLYYLDEQTWVSENPNGYPSELKRTNSIILQHIYAGYQFNRFEVYLSGRNVMGKTESTSVNADIAYYGAGIKIK